MPVKHKFVSTRQDGLDPTKVKPSDWNDDHEVIINLGTGEVIGILPLELGGTGASDAYNARINLGLGHLSTLDLLNLEADAYGMLPMNLGGTGAGDASNARSNLGLGYLAILNQINLTSDAYGTLPLNLGGTGGYDAYSARSNLGLGYLATLNQINLSSDAYGTLPLNLGGTGGYDQSSAINNLLPYQGYYGGYFLHTDGSNVSWQYANGINEAPYDGNIYGRQYNNWVTLMQGGSPGGSYGDIQFNYYGSFSGTSYFNYDFNNHIFYNTTPDFYSYYPRQINRAGYYQYADIEQWQDYYGNVLSAVSRNGGFKPASMYYWDADNNSLFYDYSSGKLAYKDPSGNVYNFY